MECLLGKDGSVEVSTDNKATWIKVGHAMTVNISNDKAAIVEDDMDSGDISQACCGMRTVTGDITAKLDLDNAGQNAIRNAHNQAGCGQIDIRIRPIVRTNYPEFIGRAIVLTCPLALDAAATQKFTATFHFNAFAPGIQA